MLWLLIVLLGVFAVLQHQAIKRLEERLDQMEREPAAPPVADVAPKPVAAKTVAIPEVRPAPIAVAPTPPREPASRPKPTLTWAAISTWLAENGLAWLGGGGLALGGLLLVVYAARQGVFTPPLRIIAAVLLGGLMIGASEWILRHRPLFGGRHLLASAVAAGAGAVTLYGAVCSAYSLYGLIPFPLAAGLAAVVSLGLLGLALRHGEALALLAILGAILTPWVTGTTAWSPPVLQAYAVLIAATGFAISGVRLWGRAGFVTGLGLLLWSFDPKFDGGAILMALAASGPMAMVLWRRTRHAEALDDKAMARFLRLPMVALMLTCVVSLFLWMTRAQQPDPVLVAGLLVVLGAAAGRVRLIPADAFAAPVGAAVLGALSMLVMTAAPQDGREVVLPWLQALTVLIPVAALTAALIGPVAVPTRTRTVLLGIGGVGVAVLASLSWPAIKAMGGGLHWLPAALLSAGLFASASLIARRVETASSDIGLGLWLAAAAELAFLAIHVAVPVHLQPLVFAVASCVLAFAAGRLRWRGLSATAVVGGLLAFATMFLSEFIAPALDGRLALPVVMSVSIGAAALLVGGARLIPDRNAAEAQSTAALMVLLTGLFIGLHVTLAGLEPGAASGVLFESAARTLLLLAAGALLVLRQGPEDGPVARWRAIAVIGLGLLHGLLLQGLAWNPWWGAGEAPVGPPLLNTLIIAFLAPAALLILSARRHRPVDRWSSLWSMAGGLFAFLWALLTIRHAFHGAEMASAGIGRAELAAYAVLLLATHQALTIRARSEWTRVVAGISGWIALLAAALIFGLYASPWWGPQSEPLASIPHALLLFSLYGLGAVLIAQSRHAPGVLGKAATGIAVGVSFALLTLLIRWAFHGAAMGGEAPGSGLETWAFSTLWAGFGLATLSLGALRRDAALRWAGLLVLLLTAGKVMVFDLARLEGVVRAASFLVVGALFLVGALATRRLRSRHEDA